MALQRIASNAQGRARATLTSLPTKGVGAEDVKKPDRAHGLCRDPRKVGITMKFLIRPGVPFHSRQLRARAMRAWRAAADLVWARWEALGEAAPELRPAAFAAYLAALDAEASAAATLAEINLGRTA
jgi:hypothetical protein